MNRVSDQTRPVNLAGKFIGVYLDDGLPVLVVLEGVYFLPIFSTPEKFEQGMRIGKFDRSNIKIQQITDHAEFVACVLGKVRLMLDPWLHRDNGTTRFTEITLEEPT